MGNGYDKETGNFIKLVLFNIKDKTSSSTYFHMIDLSIVYLIVVSGFHITILKRMINYLFKRNKLLGNILNCSIIFFYCYLLNFAVSVTRVLLMFIFTLLLRRRINNRYDILCLSGLFSLLLNPYCVFNIGFCMSYLCTIAIIYVYELQISNFLLEKILINVVAVTVSLPFVILLQHKISLWVIINSFAFSYLFAFVFVYFLLTFWIVWIKVIQSFLAHSVMFLVNANWSMNVTINIKDFSAITESFYFIVSYFAIRMLQFL
ncbi:MAG: ComEC/Rec2 family competence protein [Mycoplasmataceae bacterium]|nr:ComEC/Rec2 family competence protein [Mycoplasmataceae bacterium]